MEYRRCQLPCARFIASDDLHSKYVKSMGFSHAREAIYGASKLKFCENLHLKTLRSRLEVFERESSIFPRRTPEASAAFRESTTCGSDVELEAPFLSLSHQSMCARVRRLNSRTIIYILARRHATPFPSG